MPATASLAGSTVIPDASTEVRDHGRVLIGGSPVRVVRLTEAGARIVATVLAGEPVPPGAGSTAVVRRLLDGGLVHPDPHGPGPLSGADVTVVVPVRGDLGTALLDAVGVVAEVIVVDDASPTSPSVPSVTADGVPVRLVRRAEQGGPGAARNTGLAEVTTALVAFLDADCVPEPQWLERLLPLFADDLIAVAAPRIVAVDAPEGPPRTRLARYERVRSALDLGARPARVRARSRVSFVPSAALVARAGALRHVRGFDEAMPVGEDVDLVWRLDEAGLTVRYQPSSRVGHHHRTTPWAWARRRFDYGTSAGPLARRHPGALVPVEASAWSIGSWALLAAGHPVAAMVPAATDTLRLVRRLGTLDDPVGAAVDLAGQGHLGAGRLLARALTRPWWPLTAAVVMAVPSRRLRCAVLGAVVLPPLFDWVRARPAVGPVPFVALQIADDIAYGTGVWVGALQARTAEPLVPEITRWPRPSRYTAWRTEGVRAPGAARRADRG